MQNVTPAAAIAFVMELAPAVGFAFAAERIAQTIQRWPIALRLTLPAVCVVPYALISVSTQIFQWQWFALYLALPVVIAWLLEQAAAADPEQRGNWRDAIILLMLGLSVDLRWFDGAWPSGLQALNKLLLVDMGLYGFLAIRQLTGVGFDLCFRWSDWKTGLRELILFTPFVLTLGLALGFIHPHANRPQVGTAALRWALIFLFTALPEELFFRGWVQNLLERRVGRRMRSRYRVGAIRPVPFQQARRAFQLVLRFAGRHRRHFLWARMARTSSRGGVDHHTRQCRLDLGSLVLRPKDVSRAGARAAASGWFTAPTTAVFPLIDTQKPNASPEGHQTPPT